MRAAGGCGYGEAALAGEAARVANAPPTTRNNTLNVAAWRLGRLVAAGELDVERAREALHQAARACGHARDDGERQVARTIESGLRAGMANGRSPRQAKAAERRPREREMQATGGRERPECAGQRDLGIVM